MPHIVLKVANSELAVHNLAVGHDVPAKYVKAPRENGSGFLSLLRRPFSSVSDMLIFRVRNVSRSISRRAR